MVKIPEEIIQRHETTRPAYKRIYWILRDSLIEGRIQTDGEGYLTEEMLSEALGVSRTPLRTALARLKNEGFLQSASKSRLVISEFSREEKARLVETAVIIEGAAAALAARNATPEDIRLLRKLNSSIHSFHADNRDEAGLRGIRDLHYGFHLLIGKLSGNTFLYKYVVETRNMMRMLTAVGATHETAYSGKIAPLHDELIDAIERGDAQAAQVLIQSEILSARSLYLRGHTMVDGEAAEEDDG